MKIAQLLEADQPDGYDESDILLHAVNSLLKRQQLVYVRVKVDFAEYNRVHHGVVQSIVKKPNNQHQTDEPFVVDIGIERVQHQRGIWFPYSDLQLLTLTHHEDLHDGQDGWLLAGTVTI